jgi:pimeloyl-ACP methyl ester carboxylesterase
MRPRTAYARNGDVRIAYQVVGDGPLDLILTPGFVSHVDLWWMLPESRRFMERLASFSRLILYDKRGTGLSDPAPAPPSMEERMEDLHAVLDAAGSTEAVVAGYSEGGPLSLLFAATYPERTVALVLAGSFARWPSEDYFPQYLPLLAETRARFEEIIDHWGEGGLVDVFAPDYADDPAIRNEFGLFERLATSPAMASALLDAVQTIDVRHVLSSITVPTLILHRTEEIVPVVVARDLASQIRGARLVELPGTDHIPWLGDTDALLDPLEEFLTGARTNPAPTRALVTVLFTDIVGSTDLAGSLGDTRWRALLERHDALVAREVRRAGGAVVKSLGDGAFARFDSPARAVRAARGIVSSAPQELGVQIRAGVHTGECEILGDDLGGMGVHVGARVAAKADSGEVLVSSVVRDLVLGSPLEFEDRGRHQLKGVPGEWQLLAVTGESTVRVPAPAPASSIAPNAELARPVDLAVARVGLIAARRPAVGARLSAATRWGARKRRAPSA